MLNKADLRTAALLFLLLFVAAAAGLMYGAVPLTFAEIVRVLAGRLPFFDGTSADPVSARIILGLRLPRILVAGLVGAGLSTAGAAFQGLLKNPLADPFTIGVSSGAAVGAVTAILLGISVIPPFALAGALLALVAVYSLAQVGGRIPALTMLLAGVVVSSILSALISFLLVISGDMLQNAVFWLMGSMRGSTYSEALILALTVFIPAAVLVIFGRDLNILLLGDETAAYLGIDVTRTRRIILLIASLLTAVCVSFTGMIGFVGLLVPHTVRIMTGPDHRRLIPASFFAGGAFLIIADTFARSILPPVEIPIGVITAMTGGPFFCWLLYQKRDSITFD